MITLEDKRGYRNMAHTVLEQLGEQIDETAQKASRVASAVGDAFEDSVLAARRAAKHGSDVAVEFYVDTKKRIQRNPIETVVAATALGVAAGAAISWMLRGNG
jgi:ElaB/YqjD/DUF883 family membrane-anchored ribosome-binding protein